MLPFFHCVCPAILLATTTVGMIAQTGISTKESVLLGDFIGLESERVTACAWLNAIFALSINNRMSDQQDRDGGYQENWTCMELVDPLSH
jgi:hypothetical protein